MSVGYGAEGKRGGQGGKGMRQGLDKIKRWLFPPWWATLPLAAVSAAALYLTFTRGLEETALAYAAYLLSAYALKALPAVHVGLFNNVATIVSVLAGTIFLSEPFYWYHFIGIAAILAGTVAFNLVSSKKEQ